MVSPQSFFADFMRPGRTVFTVVMSYEFLPELYSRAKLDASSKFALNTTLTGVGKSSFDLMTTMHDHNDGQCLACLKFKYAVVDFTTRKSVQIPANSKQKYALYTKPSLAPNPYRQPARPSDSTHVFSWQRKVLPSDIDRNDHVNNSAYINICLDCAAEAAVAGHFTQFCEDIAFYRVKTLDILYQRESRFGDVLEVHCWEDPQKRLSLVFEIINKGNVSVQCLMSFYHPHKANL